MNRGLLNARPDQISLLTQGITLPLSAIPYEHLDIIVEAIVDAYEFIKLNHPSIIASKDEVEITTALRNRLTNILPEHPLLRLIVHYIARGEENLSYNGQHIEKRPDFSFKLTSDQRIFPLLAEAKVLGNSRSQSINSYCKKGILRFVDGEYSWWDSDAIMIAYALGTQTVDKDLSTLLKKDMVKKKPQYSVLSPPKTILLSTQHIPQTAHHRNFTYHPGILGPGQPGKISLWHLWLR